MSVVVAAKYKEGVAIIADKQTSAGNTKKDNATKLAYYKYSNTAIGVVGFLRDCNIMRALDEIVPYKDILDNIPINEMYVIKSIVPAIMEHLSHNKRLEGKNNNEMPSMMIYATPESIYEIGPDFSVVESDSSYLTIGCGSDKVLGFMSSIGDTSKYSEQMITDVLVGAVRKACEKDVFINDECDIIFLKRGEENE